MTDDERSDRWFTQPNIVTSLRIIGSPLLILLAYRELTLWMAMLAVFLVFTEWLDGFLARRLHVTSAIGARLDTIADAVFYSSLLIALVVLRPEPVQREQVWICIAIASYACSWIASVIKFRRLPSYHTWAAKGVWVLVGAGIVCLLADLTAWPFRVAMVCVAIANLEATGITFVLSKCRVDVPTIWHARRIESEAGR